MESIANNVVSIEELNDGISKMKMCWLYAVDRELHNLFVSVASYDTGYVSKKYKRELDKVVSRLTETFSDYEDDNVITVNSKCIKDLKIKYKNILIQRRKGLIYG